MAQSHCRLLRDLALSHPAILSTLSVLVESFEETVMILAQNAAQERQDTLNELRISTLEIVLLLIGGGVWCLLAVSYIVIGYPPLMALVLCALVEIACAISYALRKEHFGWAARTLILGLWVSNVIAT